MSNLSSFTASLITNLSRWLWELSGLGRDAFRLLTLLLVTLVKCWQALQVSKYKCLRGPPCTFTKNFKITTELGRVCFKRRYSRGKGPNILSTYDRTVARFLTGRLGRYSLPSLEPSSDSSASSDFLLAFLTFRFAGVRGPSFFSCSFLSCQGPKRVRKSCWRASLYRTAWRQMTPSRLIQRRHG